LVHLWEWAQVPSECSLLPTSWASHRVCTTSLLLVHSSLLFQVLASDSRSLDRKDSASSPSLILVSDRIPSNHSLHRLAKLSQTSTASVLQSQSQQGSLLKMDSVLKLRSSVKLVSAVSLQRQELWVNRQFQICGNKPLDSSPRIHHSMDLVSKINSLPTHTCQV